MAEFIVQSESANEITNVLKIVKQWNHKWTPPFFMSDYSEAEQLAIMEAFPEYAMYCATFIMNRLGRGGYGIIITS